MAWKVAAALLDALAALSPIDCAGCGSADRGLCDDCRARLSPAVTPRTLSDGTTIFTSLRYEGVARQTLLAFKESGRTDVARPLGLALAPALARAIAHASADHTAAGQSGVEIVTVPTSRAAWRRRGYDPVSLLCRRAGIEVAKVLVHDRATSSQKTLGADSRERNLRNSMRAKGPLAGRRFLLVDDVVTTGSTFFEAARALRDAGGEVVGGAALAFTPKMFGANRTTLMTLL